MNSSGNGTIMQCIENLMKLVRGEVYYDRIRGLPSTIIGQPKTKGVSELEEEANWVIKTYEPRSGESSER